MLKKNRLSEESKHMLAHILAHGPQSLAQLRRFTDRADSELVKRLRNLRTAGWLEVVEGAPEMRWNIRAAAAPLFAEGRTPKRSSKDESKPMGEMPLPRQINVMAGKYEPAPFTPPRQGSMDFRTIASRGVHC